MDFSIESSGLSAVKKVRQLITDGILALVMDTDNISEKSVNMQVLQQICQGKLRVWNQRRKK